MNRAVDSMLLEAKEVRSTTPEKDQELVFEDVAEILGLELPELDPIVDGAFECGDKVELVGGSKMRKSFFLIAWLLHIAMGIDFLGLKIPKRRRVVYVNLELKPSWLHRRLVRYAQSYGISPEEIGDYFKVVNARGKNKIVREKLAVALAGRDVDLVALDPRYKLHLPGEAENAGEGVAGILELMDMIAELGPAVLVVHHDSKGDSSDKSIADRGSGSGWAGRDVDAKFTLSAQRDEPETGIVVESLCRNYPPIPPFCIRWLDHRFELADDLSPVKYGAEDRRREAQAKPSVDECEAAILALAGEPMGRTELVAKVAGQVKRASRETIRAAIDGLVRTGKLAHTPRTGNKNGAVRYGLPAAIRTPEPPQEPA